ncbi:MAG: type II secretion system F family protein [Actinomycetota bacterium]|nr:type II secretion system F family protein [Actinomycetota bacterium]
MPLVASLLAAAAVFIAVMAYASWIRYRVRVDRREVVARYSVRRTARLDDSVEPPPAGSLVGRIDRLIVRYRPGGRTRITLDNAGLSLTPGAWLLIRVGVSALAGAVLWVLMSSPLVSVLGGIVIGFAGAHVFVNRRRTARRKQFNEDLPEFFLLLSSSLRAGLPFIQALESAASEGEGEIQRQMRRATAEIRFGVNPDNALMGVADRMESQDMHWAVTALTLGRSIGGNFSRILESVADTVRRRSEVQRQLATLSAEGRMSAVVMVAMPLTIFAFMFFTQRDYISSMWTTTGGIVMLVLAGLLILVGWFWARALGKVEM